MSLNPEAISRICVTTNSAASAGLLSSTIVSWLLLGKPDLSMTINGCLAGLVAITASCAYVSVGSSLIIGTAAGAIVVFAVLAFDRMRIDDPVGALSVHLVNGVLGTLAVGLFAEGRFLPDTTANGLFFGGGWSLLANQTIGVAAVAAFTFALSYAAWVAIKATIGIRVSEQEEIDGLDVGEHGMSAYPEFAVAADRFGERTHPKGSPPSHPRIHPGAEAAMERQIAPSNRLT